MGMECTGIVVVVVVVVVVDIAQPSERPPCPVLYATVVELNGAVGRSSSRLGVAIESTRNVVFVVALLIHVAASPNNVSVVSPKMPIDISEWVMAL